MRALQRKRAAHLSTRLRYAVEGDVALSRDVVNLAGRARVVQNLDERISKVLHVSQLHGGSDSKQKLVVDTWLLF